MRPNLTAAAAAPAADAAALAGLAAWCDRYTPWTAVDPAGRRPGGLGGDAGLWLDISGCAHLFGGEATLLADLRGRLAGFGLAAVAAVAATPGAAWAVARFGEGVATAPERAIVEAAATADVLAPLPAAALRLLPDAVERLDRVGLRRIGDLLSLPRAPLAARFGDLVLNRLDQALGHADEPVSPDRPVPAFRTRRAFAEPVGRAEDLERATALLLAELAAGLEVAGQGVRRLELAAHRCDGTTATAAIGTSRPVRDPDHLRKLFREPLAGLDPGFGVEVVTLNALVVEPLAPAQPPLDPAGRMSGDGGAVPESLARLIDRLGNRLTPERVLRLTARESHLPERASVPVPAFSHPPPAASPSAAAGPGDPDDDTRPRQPRPPLLLASPEPVEVVAPVPDGPPALFRRGRVHHRIVAAEGPERIGPEWWQQDDGHCGAALARVRDYYRLEDDDGRRFWVFRDGPFRADRPARWYLHGLFA